MFEVSNKQRAGAVVKHLSFTVCEMHMWMNQV